MKKYFEFADGNSVKFWEIKTDGNKVITRYGKSGSAGRTSEKSFADSTAAQKEHDKLVREKIKKGYAEAGDTAAGEKEDPIVKASASTPKIITENEAEKRFQFYRYINGGCGDKGRYYYFEGDTVIEGDLNTGEFCDEESEDDHPILGIIVNGDLTVTGQICQEECDFGETLLVLGNLKAKHIDKGGAEFYITGDCKVAGAIYGYYNHGMLTVEGETTAKFIIKDDHEFDFGYINKESITVNNYSDYGECDYYAPDLVENFVKEVLNMDEEEPDINIKRFIKRLDEGKSVLKKGAKSTRQKTEELIAKSARQGKYIVEFDLSDKKLDSFPLNLLEIKTLKKLDLSENPIGNIPEEIGELENLEELYLKECCLSELPVNISRLKNLKILDICSNDIILPESIGELKNLTVLRMGRNQPLSLPKSIVELQNLKELDICQCSEASPIDFPEEITKLKNLEKLDLSSNSFKTIPASIAELKKLEELNLGSSLCYLDTIPDLSPLANLKVVKADGLISYTTRPYPNQDLIKSFFNVTSLEELYIDRHGREKETIGEETFGELLANLAYNPRRQAELKTIFSDTGAKSGECTLRENLKPDHINGISNLKNLKIVDLSFNDLESLPEEFYLLENLREINLRYNHLPKAEREKIVRAFPKAKIDLRNNTVDNDDDTEERKKMVKLIQAANALRGYVYTDNLKALNKYDQALSYITSGKVSDEYNQIYCHYSKMWIYGQLAYRVDSLTDDKKKEYEIAGNKEAEICLSLVPNNTMVWHFTDEGQFHEEVIRYASNFIAWGLYVRNDDDASLQKALEIIDRGCAYSDEPNYFYLWDTKVRILLKMGRIDEAYRIVDRILTISPEFSDFQEFKKHRDFLEWRKNSMQCKSVSAKKSL